MTTEINKYIVNELKNIEDEFNVKIIYACESGSRAWGFSNPYSDYDIRFIYIRPLKEYLTLNQTRDVIDDKDLKNKEYDYPLDFSGWDIRKALYLHWKSNPSLREYLKSNIVYYGDTSLFDNLPEFNRRSLLYHYGSMTKANWNKYVKNKHTDDFSPRVVKTYCYCIRQILAWILLDDGLPLDDVPINTDEIIRLFREHDQRFSPKLLTNMELLLDYYRSGCKLNKFNEEVILSLSEFIQTYIDVMTVEKPVKEEDKPIQLYNNHFYNILTSEYDSLKLENSMLRTTIGRNEAYINRLKNTNPWRN